MSVLKNEMEVPVPNMEKRWKVIKRIKNDKLGGEDDIITELIKFGNANNKCAFRDLSSCLLGLLVS